MQEKKIVYFDYWTVGINNFKLVDQSFKDRGFETKLIHLNSWRGIQEPIFQEIQGINCYDIKYYNTNLLFKVLKEEKPIAVVMLNASFITDRTIILACKKLGIKSIYLMHGSELSEEFIDDGIRLINKTLKKNRIKKAIKHIRGTVWNYLYSIANYDQKYIYQLHAYKVLLKTFINPAKYLLFPPPAFDLQPDLTLVYGISEKEFYKKKYKSAIKVVGNPDLDKYFQEIDSLKEDKELFCKTNNIPLNKPYITYIDEGLVENKTWDNEYRINFFTNINKACSEAGFHLVIKLHPKTAKGPNRASFDLLKDVTIISQVNFPKLIYFTDLCISHYSTTLIYPILLDKPVLVPRWDNSSNLLTIYTNKEVTFIHSLDEFKQCIKNKIYTYDRREYLANNVPYMDGKTSERIANHIFDLIK